jgi:hypothetical protein
MAVGGPGGGTTPLRRRRCSKERDRANPGLAGSITACAGREVCRLRVKDLQSRQDVMDFRIKGNHADITSF